MGPCFLQKNSQHSSWLMSGFVWPVESVTSPAILENCMIWNENTLTLLLCMHNFVEPMHLRTHLYWPLERSTWRETWLWWSELEHHTDQGCVLHKDKSLGWCYTVKTSVSFWLMNVCQMNVSWNDTHYLCVIPEMCPYNMHVSSWVCQNDISANV